ncbi:MAG TPA: hypothetical protein PK778_08610 [Bacillota bacterium]|nr:hypothetical protein [Bacillota bacterium]
MGHTVNFKTRKKSYKSKEKIWNNPEEWMIFENTQSHHRRTGLGNCPENTRR